MKEKAIRRIIEAWLRLTLAAVLGGTIAAMLHFFLAFPDAYALAIGIGIAAPILAYSIIQGEAYHRMKDAHEAQMERVQESTEDAVMIAVVLSRIDTGAVLETYQTDAPTWQGCVHDILYWLRIEVLPYWAPNTLRLAPCDGTPAEPAAALYGIGLSYLLVDKI